MQSVCAHLDLFGYRMLIKLCVRVCAVWNPWIAKSKTLADFDPLEYTRMVCVESASLGLDQPLELSPGQSWVGSVHLSFEKLSVAAPAL